MNKKYLNFNVNLYLPLLIIDKNFKIILSLHIYFGKKFKRLKN